MQVTLSKYKGRIKARMKIKLKQKTSKTELILLNATQQLDIQNKHRQNRRVKYYQNLAKRLTNKNIKSD